MIKAVLVIINNYFHDVATAFLLASAIILWILGRQAAQNGPEAMRALERAYPTLTKIAQGAIVWIVIGGIPRLIFFTEYEWDPAVVKGLVPALAIKHILMATAVLLGAVMWAKTRKLIAGSADSSE